MKDIGSHFDDLINNLIDKQELKPFVLDSVKNDEPDQKNAILKILKRLEHETMNHIYESYENSNNNKEQDKKNIAENQLFINKTVDISCQGSRVVKFKSGQKHSLIIKKSRV